VPAALAVLVLVPGVSSGRGAPVPRQVGKDFKMFIIQGERPEIAECMAAAANSVRHDSRFRDARWQDDTSIKALMHETEHDGHLMRTITMPAQALVRGSGFFDDWVPIQVTCEQRDEGYPNVTVTPGRSGPEDT
jgi:hypothetical protein